MSGLQDGQGVYIRRGALLPVHVDYVGQLGVIELAERPKAVDWYFPVRFPDGKLFLCLATELDAA